MKVDGAHVAAVLARCSSLRISRNVVFLPLTADLNTLHCIAMPVSGYVAYEASKRPEG